MTEGKKNYITALDFGGSFLKWTLANPGSPYSSIPRKYFSKIKMNSSGSKAEILGVFLGVLETAFQTAESIKTRIMGIGISTPGPFNLGKGISLMKHKFASIYGVNLKEEIKKHFSLEENFPIKFIFDSTAFLTGEAFFGAARSFNRIIGITLGTGIGSAFMLNGKIIEKAKGLPPQGGSYLFLMPHEGGTVEDKISRKAIINRYIQMGGRFKEDIDVDKISLLADSGDLISIEVFKELGLNLGKILKPIALEFMPGCIVFGGAISKAFHLFSRPLKKELRNVASLKKITPCKFWDLSALYGVIGLFSHESLFL